LIQREQWGNTKLLLAKKENVTKKKDNFTKKKEATANNFNRFPVESAQNST
jgi:hypothetical protein